MLLADATTGRELVRLTTLRPIVPTPLAFSPDGTKLVASTTQKTVLVWDLRRIRDQLVPIGLDWDAPPYPTASAIDALVRFPRRGRCGSSARSSSLRRGAPPNWPR